MPEGYKSQGKYNYSDKLTQKNIYLVLNHLMVYKHLS